MKIEKKAVEELKKRARKGDIEAIKLLAGRYDCLSIYFLKWNIKAGELGDIEAQENVAFFYLASRMRAKQSEEKKREYLIQAKAWYEKMLQNPQLPLEDKIRVAQEIREIDELLSSTHKPQGKSI